MAASAKKILEAKLKVRNADEVGQDVIFEFHEVTYDSDKTVEVTTALTSIIGSVFMEKTATPTVVDSGSGDDSTLVCGSDCIITAGKVTVGCTYNNSATFMIVFWGCV